MERADHSDADGASSSSWSSSSPSSPSSSPWRDNLGFTRRAREGRFTIHKTTRRIELSSLALRQLPEPVRHRAGGANLHNPVRVDDSNWRIVSISVAANICIRAALPSSRPATLPPLGSLRRGYRHPLVHLTLQSLILRLSLFPRSLLSICVTSFRHSPYRHYLYREMQSISNNEATLLFDSLLVQLNNIYFSLFAILLLTSILYLKFFFATCSSFHSI